MIANSAVVAALVTFLLAAWIAGELSFLALFKVGLFRQHGTAIAIITGLVFLNLFAVCYSVARRIYLRETGRKLSLVDRQLSTSDTALPDLHEELKG